MDITETLRTSQGRKRDECWAREAGERTGSGLKNEMWMSASHEKRKKGERKKKYGVIETKYKEEKKKRGKA